MNDQEVIDNLDLLLNLDAVKDPKDLDVISDLVAIQAVPDEDLTKAAGDSQEELQIPASEGESK